MNPGISFTLVLAVTAILFGLSNAHGSHGHGATRPGNSYPTSKCGQDISTPNDVCDMDNTNLDCHRQKIACECPKDFQWWNDIKKCRGGVKAGGNCTAAEGVTTELKAEADWCVHGDMQCTAGKCECLPNKKCEGGPPAWDPKTNGSPRLANGTAHQYWLLLVLATVSGFLAVDWQ